MGKINHFFHFLKIFDILFKHLMDIVKFFIEVFLILLFFILNHLSVFLLVIKC